MWGRWLRGKGVVLCCDHWGVIFNRIKSLPCKSRILIRERVVRAQSKQDSHTVLWQLPLPRYYTLYIPKFSFGACLERDAEKAAQAFSCMVTYTHCPLRSVGFFSAWASAQHTRVHGTLCGRCLLVPCPENAPPTDQVPWWFTPNDRASVGWTHKNDCFPLRFQPWRSFLHPEPK